MTILIFKVDRQGLRPFWECHLKKSIVQDTIYNALWLNMKRATIRFSLCGRFEITTHSCYLLSFISGRKITWWWQSSRTSYQRERTYIRSTPICLVSRIEFAMSLRVDWSATRVDGETGKQKNYIPVYPPMDHTQNNYLSGLSLIEDWFDL